MHYWLYVMDHLLECWLLVPITLSWMKPLIKWGQLFLYFRTEICFNFLSRQNQKLKQLPLLEIKLKNMLEWSFMCLSWVQYEQAVEKETMLRPVLLSEAIRTIRWEMHSHHTARMVNIGKGMQWTEKANILHLYQCRSYSIILNL